MSRSVLWSRGYREEVAEADALNGLDEVGLTLEHAHMVASAGESLSLSARVTMKAFIEIRERWHVKRHLLYQGFASGTIGLRLIGALLAQRYHRIKRVLSSPARLAPRLGG